MQSLANKLIGKTIQTAQVIGEENRVHLHLGFSDGTTASLSGGTSYGGELDLNVPGLSVEELEKDTH